MARWQLQLAMEPKTVSSLTSLIKGASKKPHLRGLLCELKKSFG